MYHSHLEKEPFPLGRVGSQIMDSSTGISCLKNQIQHKKLGYDCENRFSAEPKFALIALKVGEN